MYALDLHTHSQASPDGSLTTRQYSAMLEQGVLDCIAVTDHDTIAFAQELQAKLGARIIVGEEITAKEGEIIGLYLHEAVPPGLSIKQTVQAIRRQHGLVYVPHPFETVRNGLSAKVLADIASHVDIVETHNGRAIFQHRGEDALHWATMHGVPGAASSDAHGWHGWGKTYSNLSEAPTRETLVRLLERATYASETVGLLGALYPKFNRLRKKLA
jgi:predicted metal-dependent phosphoesterase TrpH